MGLLDGLLGSGNGNGNGAGGVNGNGNGKGNDVSGATEGDGSTGGAHGSKGASNDSGAVESGRSADAADGEKVGDSGGVSQSASKPASVSRFEAALRGDGDRVGPATQNSEPLAPDALEALRVKAAESVGKPAFGDGANHILRLFGAAQGVSSADLVEPISREVTEEFAERRQVEVAPRELFMSKLDEVRAAERAGLAVAPSDEQKVSARDSAANSRRVEKSDVVA